ncbi:MAG: 50S ribosomal protein L29 [Flavobacteriales bacterium AspAUS03]
MKASEIRTRSIEQIQDTLKIHKKQYQQMKFDHHISSLKKPIELRCSRREIARLATILCQKKNEVIVDPIHYEKKF